MLCVYFCWYPNQDTLPFKEKLYVSQRSRPTSNVSTGLKNISN